MPPPPAVHAAIDLIGNAPPVRLRRTGAGCSPLFLKFECPGRGLDVGTGRADLERAVRRHGYAAVTDKGRPDGVATGLELLRGAERTPCETRR